MASKKLFSSLILAALLVALTGCKDDPMENPADEGKKAAQELYDCFSGATDETAQKACLSTMESKYSKYNDNQDFQDALKQALETFGNLPDWFMCLKFDECGGGETSLAELGRFAADELCACFSEANGQMDEMACMMGLMGKYEGLFRDMQGEGGEPEFEDAFSERFMGSCGNIPDWFLCMWAPELCGEGPGDDDPAEKGLEAAGVFCTYFTENPDAEMMSMMTNPQILQYLSYIMEGNEQFLGALFSGLFGVCDAVPNWFYCMLFQMEEYCASDGPT